MATWLDPGQCGSCKHCGMDMDMDPFCTHPMVVKKHPWGLAIHHAINHFCGEDLKLRKPKDEAESTPVAGS